MARKASGRKNTPRFVARIQYVLNSCESSYRRDIVTGGAKRLAILPKVLSTFPLFLPKKTKEGEKNRIETSLSLQSVVTKAIDQVTEALDQPELISSIVSFFGSFRFFRLKCFIRIGKETPDFGTSWMPFEPTLALHSRFDNPTRLQVL